MHISLSFSYSRSQGGSGIRRIGSSYGSFLTRMKETKGGNSVLTRMQDCKAVLRIERESQTKILGSELLMKKLFILGLAMVFVIAMSVMVMASDETASDDHTLGITQSAVRLLAFEQNQEISVTIIEDMFRAGHDQFSSEYDGDQGTTITHKTIDDTERSWLNLNAECEATIELMYTSVNSGQNTNRIEAQVCSEDALFHGPYMFAIVVDDSITNGEPAKRVFNAGNGGDKTKTADLITEIGSGTENEVGLTYYLAVDTIGDLEVGNGKNITITYTIKES